MTNMMFRIYSFIYEKFLLAQGSVLNSMWLQLKTKTKAEVPEDNLVIGNFLVHFSIVLLKNTVCLKQNNQEVY